MQLERLRLSQFREVLLSSAIRGHEIRIDFIKAFSEDKARPQVVGTGVSAGNDAMLTIFN